MRISAPLVITGLLGFTAMAGGYLLVDWRKVEGGIDQDASLVPAWTVLLAEVPIEEFERVAGDPLDFPRDHGAHTASPVETWNLTANLHDTDGRILSFQLSLARLALVAPDAEPATAVWDLREVYRGHTILVRDEGASSAEERLRRGFAGLAGYDAPSREWRLDDWFLKIEEGATHPALTIAATVGADAALELRLEPEKQAVSPEVDSVDAPFRGYSLTRLAAKGVLVTAEGRESVRGTAWFDHLWGDLPFPTGPTVWDRLLLQVDDGSDILMVRTRRRDGSGTPTLQGFIVGPEGNVSQIGSAAVAEPLRRWAPAGEPSEYPVAWRLNLGGDREMVVSPLVENQLHEFVIPVWSGAVTAHGDLGSGPVEAVGILQLNGYAAP